MCVENISILVILDANDANGSGHHSVFDPSQLCYCYVCFQIFRRAGLEYSYEFRSKYAKAVILSLGSVQITYLLLVNSLVLI